MKTLICFLVLTLHLTLGIETAPSQVDIEAQKFLNDVNAHLAILYNKDVLANWQNEIHGPNDLIAEYAEIAAKEIISYIKSISGKVSKFRRLNVTSENLKRQLMKIPLIGYEVLSGSDLELMYAIITNMSDMYTNTKLCPYNGNALHCNLTLIPDVQNIIHNTNNVHEIEYYWSEWRNKTGPTSQNYFQLFVNMYRKTAQLNGFKVSSDYWYKDFELSSKEMHKLLDNLLNELRPLFLEFHAYVRGSLRRIYGTELIPIGQPYPQHLSEIFIGNAYTSPEKFKLPFATVPATNLTENLLNRGLSNIQRVIWNAASFFRSIGFPQIEEQFWSENVMPKASIAENEYACWHKAWKYYANDHFNLTYCPKLDEERFFNMFEAISDVYYSLAYGKQPTLFQEEPIPNFSDALGEMFSLSASSPRYMEKLKILGKQYQTKEARINRLFLQGLRTIFILPVFYILDRYRVDIIDNRISVNNNCAYWKLTEMLTGAEPPLIRSNHDFDMPAKILTGVDDQYTSQILSTVLQYQLYKHFCTITKQYSKENPNLPLDLCDLSNHQEIGPVIWNAMTLGSSKTYKDILYLMTNTTELSMKSLLEYYQPLYEWLKEENQKENYEIGWTKSKKCIS